MLQQIMNKIISNFNKIAGHIYHKKYIDQYDIFFDFSQKIDYTKLIEVDKKYRNHICIYTMKPCENPKLCKKNKICNFMNTKK